MAPKEVRNPSTIVSVVYVTAPQTFNGPVAGYTTMGFGGDQQGSPISVVSAPNQPQTQNPVAPSTANVQPSQQAQTTQTAQPTQQTQQSQPAQSTQQQSTQSGQDSASSSSLLLAPSSTGQVSSITSDSSPLSTNSASFPSSSVAVASSTSTAKPAQPSGGMSPGAKGGIAFGVLLLCGALAAVFLVLYRRKKAEQDGYNRTADEKSDPFADSAALNANRAPSMRSTRTASTAPRLSLRPVTQFDPNLAARKSLGNPLAMASAKQMSNGPAGQRQMNNPANPFGHHAEASNQSAPSMSDSRPSTAQGPTPIASLSSMTSGPSMPIGPAAAAGVAGAAMGAAAAHRGPAGANNGTLPDSTTTPSPETQAQRAPSPSASEYSMTSMAPAVAGAAAMGGPGASVVHRVQLDFKPSMEDELELHAGQLVRLLHEYDDGWALCIRMDRSKQGVAPRTCLSTRPVKPRAPQGGPRGPPPPGMRMPPGQMRPMGPPRGAPRPMSPAGGRQSPRPYPNGPFPGPPSGRQSPAPQQSGAPRPMSPAMGAGHSPVGYVAQPPPLSPGNGRSSPGPQFPQPRSMSPSGNRSRSNSMQSNGGTRSPPGPSRMNPGPRPAPGPGMPESLRSGSPQPGMQVGKVTRKPTPGQAM